MHQQHHARAELHQLSKALLRLHKALLDGERAAYERMHGAITSNGTYLRLVLGDPAFAWLRHLSRLMAELDDLADSDDASAAEKIPELMASLRTLLTPVEGDDAFRGRYHDALQRDPNTVLAHAAVKNLLGVRSPEGRVS
jgi:hypothetical protein